MENPLVSVNNHKIESRTMSPTAYWIKSNHQMIDVGGQTHIFHIIENPSLFGLTKDDVETSYIKHHEELYTEGKARVELIKRATQSGWIRVRKYNEYWSIQFDLYEKRKAVILYFVKWTVSKKKSMSKYDPLVLVGFDDNYCESIEAMKFLRKK